MNKYSVAIGEWRVDVESAVQILGASPGITTFNTQAEIVRVKTNQFREKVDGAEVAFLASKKKTEAGRAALLKWMKTELGAKVHTAIQKFVTSKMAAALDIVGLTGDMAPFVAQITQESADFRTRIAQVEMECSEFWMHLQTASATQQLDILTTMLRLIPLMCHLMYPASSQWPSLTPAPGARVNVVRIGPDVQKRAPPPDDTERGKLAKVTKVPKSEVVIVSDTPSPLSSPTAQPSTRTGTLTSLAASAVLVQSQFHTMQQSAGHYGSHPQYGLGAATHLATPGYTFRFPVPGGRVMPPPGFQFPGVGFQAGPGPCPGHLASHDYQDYLEGAPHPSHDKRDPHAGEPKGDLTVDEAEELIPIDMDGEDGSDCEIIEVVTSLPVTMPVKTSKAKQKPIDQAMKQAAAKVGAARVEEILGAISFSDGGDADTMPSTTSVKKTSKSKKMKKCKDSASDAPSGSEETKAAEKKEAEQKAKIKEEGKLKAMQKDYPIIKTLQVELGLPFDRVNQYDMTSHMPRINAWCQANKGKGDWHGVFITSTSTVSARAAYVRDLNNPTLKLDNKTQSNYQNAIAQIDDFTAITLMKKSRWLSGAPNVFITHLARMFVDEQGRKTCQPRGMNVHGITFGLIWLHEKDAICQYQYHNIIAGGKCPICAYCTDNHDSVNNHIRTHWCMGLVCSFYKYIDATMNGTLGHGQAIHAVEYLKK